MDIIGSILKNNPFCPPAPHPGAKAPGHDASRTSQPASGNPAPSPQAAPPDSVLLATGQTSPARQPASHALSDGAATINPWPEMMRTGLLTTGSVVAGPIGQVLSQADLEGLQAVAERIEAAGLRISLPGPKCRDFKDARHMRMLTPEQVVETLKPESQVLKTRLCVTRPGTDDYLYLESLHDLQGLDLQFGLGLEAAPNRPEAAKALLSLLERGWTLSSGRSSSSGLSQAWGEIGRYGGSNMDALGPGVSSWQHLQGDRGLMILDYLHGSGDRHNLGDLDLVDRIQELVKSGHDYHYRWDDTDSKGGWPIESIRLSSFLEENRRLMVGRRDDAFVRVTNNDLPDAATLEDRIAVVATAWKREAAPALSRAGISLEQYRFEDALADDTSGRFDLGTRAQVVAALLCTTAAAAASSESPHRGEWTKGPGALQDAVVAATQLLNNTQSPQEARRVAGRLVRVLASSPSIPPETASFYLERLALAARRDDPASIQLFERLFEAFGSLPAAAEAQRLVEAEGAGRDVDERTSVMLDLAAKEPRGPMAVLDDYRVVAENRLPGESLEDAGRGFGLLLAVAGDHPERVPEVYKELREEARAGLFGAEPLDAVMNRVVASQLLAGHAPSRQSAMDRVVRAAATPPMQPTNAGAVEVGNGQVVVGGIRLPVRTNSDG